MVVVDCRVGHVVQHVAPRVHVWQVAEAAEAVEARHSVFTCPCNIHCRQVSAEILRWLLEQVVCHLGKFIKGFILYDRFNVRLMCDSS